MCLLSNSDTPEPPPPVAPPDVLDQDAPDMARKRKTAAQRGASGTKRLRTLALGSGTVNGSTRSGGLNI